MEISENIAISYPVEKLYSLFVNNMPDYNVSRTTEYIMTEFGEQEAEYPIIVIESENHILDDGGASQNFLQKQTEVDGSISNFHFRKVTCTVFISCITQKDTEFTVNINGNDVLLSGKKFNQFFTSQVSKLLDNYMDDELKQYFDSFKLVGVEPEYNPDNNMWETLITIEVAYKDIYKKVVPVEEVIASADTNIQVQTN